MVFVTSSLAARLAASGGLALALVIASSEIGRPGPAPAHAAALVAPPAQPGLAAAIVATGTATVEVTPDLARVIVAVQTTASTATEAEAANATAADRVRTLLARAGVAPADIKTLAFQVWPQYDYRNGQPSPTGFMASHELQVTVHDLHRIGAVIDAAVAGGATTVQGITYDVNDHTTAAAHALAAAVRDAQAKARAMADAAGITLGRVVAINESQNSPYPYPLMRTAAAPSQAGATQVSPPEIQLTVNVTVGWTIG